MTLVWYIICWVPVYFNCIDGLSLTGVWRDLRYGVHLEKYGFAVAWGGVFGA